MQKKPHHHHYNTHNHKNVEKAALHTKMEHLQYHKMLKMRLVYARCYCFHTKSSMDCAISFIYFSINLLQNSSKAKSCIIFI